MPKGFPEIKGANNMLHFRFFQPLHLMCLRKCAAAHGIGARLLLKVDCRAMFFRPFVGLVIVRLSRPFLLTHAQREAPGLL